jgi:hypothetical protein
VRIDDFGSRETLIMIASGLGGLPQLRTIYSTLSELSAGIIRPAFPRSWDENHLTYSLCTAISAASPYAFRSKDGKRVDVLIELFKNSGTPENRHGDVAVVVTFEGPGGC